MCEFWIGRDITSESVKWSLFPWLQFSTFLHILQMNMGYLSSCNSHYMIIHIPNEKSRNNTKLAIFKSYAITRIYVVLFLFLKYHQSLFGFLMFMHEFYPLLSNGWNLPEILGWLSPHSSYVLTLPFADSSTLWAFIR